MAEIRRINKKTAEYVPDGKQPLNPELEAFLRDSASGKRLQKSREWIRVNSDRQ